MNAPWSAAAEVRLNAEVARHPYPLVFATVSGAHLYGFPSPDSDYDLRGVHVLPAHEVLGLDTGPDTIELRMTMYDPTFYKGPWVSDVKTFTRVKREATTFFGWYGLFSGITEGICAPMNEVDSYNTLFRDPAGKGVAK